MTEPCDHDIDPAITSQVDHITVLTRKEGECVKEDGPEVVKRYIGESGAGRISSLIEDHNDIGIVVNDRNRPTPTYLVLEYLHSNFSGLDEVLRTIHIATGTHSPPTEEEIRTILGDTYGRWREKVHIHRAKRKEEHTLIGTTSRGTELYIDRGIVDHDLLIMINSVEPHYFAGFTGGRKSIVPGLSYYGTVEKNHSHALEEGSRTLALEGNPVHEDMVEACDLFLSGRQHLSIQIVQAPGQEITDLFWGNIHESFMKGVKVAKSNFCIPVDGEFDLVITYARPPMDRTLYQAQKAIENGKLALRDGGVLILSAKMEEGVGQETFWDLLTSRDTVEEVLDSISAGYVLGYHKAAKIAQLAKRADIFVVSSLDDELLSRGFLHGLSSMEEAVIRAKEKLGDEPRTLVIPDGTVTVPMRR